MDKREVVTRYEAQILKIGVSANSEIPINLMVYDRDRANTVLTNRDKIIKGKETFFVRMPLCPNNTVIAISGSGVITNIEQLTLQRKLDLVDMKNPDIAGFVYFAQRFAYNAGYMPVGLYKSDDKRFTINYQEILTDDKGREILSPMHIGEISGIIQVSQKWCVKATVPMRMAILLHEFSHKYLNEDIDNESEADLNALLVYLALGYPRVEAYEAFLTTFLSVPDNAYTKRLQESNKLRYENIKKFITEFEQNKLLVY
jgi:hypothetical protein